MAEERTAAKKPAKKAAEKKTEPQQAATTIYEVAVPLLNIREKASLTSKVIGMLDEGEEVAVCSKTPQGFGKLDGRDGYIKLEFAKAKIDVPEEG